MTIRLLLVDDHPVVLNGLGAALAEQEGLAVVAMTGTAAAARAVLAREPIDVGLVDIRLPDGSGLQLISEPMPGHAAPAWIVLSTFDAPQYLAAALKLGAAGYLLKTAPLVEIVGAIRQVAAGGTAFAARHLRSARSADSLRLTDREREVVEGVLRGRSNDEIAADLDIARKTVEAHLTKLFARFEVATRTELALKADREGWLETGAGVTAGRSG